MAGLLRTQYLSYFPLAYISYASGRSSSRGAACRASTRVVLVSCAHAHVVAPALCIAAVAALRDITDLSIIKGALYASIGSPCAWLSLSLTRYEIGTTAQLVACNYIASLIAVPLSTYVLCGLATFPSWRSVGETCAAVWAPYCLGAVLSGRRGERGRHEARVRLCALALLYKDCCGRLRDADGLMYLGDVLLTLILEATCLATSSATCWLYERCGLLHGGDVLAVALTSIPKCIGSTGATCSWGTHNLPAAMATPLQAALLAAIAARRQPGEPDGHRQPPPH